jgi:hypothetical protein
MEDGPVGRLRIPRYQPSGRLAVHALGLGSEGGFERIQLAKTLAKPGPGMMRSMICSSA